MGPLLGFMGTVIEIWEPIKLKERNPTLRLAYSKEPTTKCSGVRMRKPQFMVKQGRKPTGLLDQIGARVMAKETADENDFALELLQPQPEGAVLEIGCGHEDTLADARFRATFPSEIHHIRPEAEIAKLARDAGFEAIDLRGHTRGDMRFSFVIGARAQEKAAKLRRY
jgi:hypothetical protein